MATKLDVVIREIETDLTDEFKAGTQLKFTAAGVFFKPPHKRWTSAKFLSWGEALQHAYVQNQPAAEDEKAANEG